MQFFFNLQKLLFKLIDIEYRPSSGPEISCLVSQHCLLTRECLCSHNPAEKIFSFSYLQDLKYHCMKITRDPYPKPCVQTYKKTTNTQTARPKPIILRFNYMILCLSCIKYSTQCHKKYLCPTKNNVIGNGEIQQSCKCR